MVVCVVDGLLDSLETERELATQEDEDLTHLQRVRGDDDALDQLVGIAFDEMVEDLRSGRLDHDVPSHGTLIRVRRNGGLRAERSEVATERAEAKAAREARASKESS